MTFDKKSILAVVIACFIALFFRTYPVNPIHRFFKSNDELAKSLVREGLFSQVLPRARVRFPDLNRKQLEAVVKEQVERLIEADPDNYRDTLRRMRLDLAKRVPPQDQKEYLLESDPYYYYYLTERILSTGRISDQVKHGKYFDPLRRAPRGDWVEILWHPYLGAIWHKLMRIFDPKISLMASLCYYPFWITLLTAPLFFSLLRGMGLSRFACFIGVLALTLAPMHIHRSAYGWYDTDPYNILFPTAVILTYFSSLTDSRRQILAGIVGGCLTALYSYFWIGWPFIVAVILASQVFFMLVRMGKKDWAVFSWRYFLSYGLSTLLLLVVFWSPAGALEKVSYAYASVAQFSLESESWWPSIFVNVQEAGSIYFSELVNQSGNVVTFAVALLGLAGFGIRAVQAKYAVSRTQWLFFSLLFAGLLILSLRTMRFAILWIIPTAVLTAWGAECLLSLLQKFPGRAFERRLKGPLILASLRTLVAVMILPVQFVSAHYGALGTPKIMNDTWHQSLVQVRESTEPGAVIYSWWPPGHFLKAISRRGVVVDGATQQYPETYWIARFFMSLDEREAAGILRMLYLGGNAAVERLESAGLSLADAIDWVNKILPLRRAAADKILSGILPADERLRLLDLTHGDESPLPLYAFVYSENMPKNLGLSLMARWDFHKAQNIQKRFRANLTDLVDTSTSYVELIKEISGRVLKYNSEKELEREDDETWYFENGLSVNKLTKASWLVTRLGFRGMPLSLFYYENGKLVEKTNDGDKILDSSALVYDDNGILKSVVADRDLIRSMMFRFYYLDGKDLKFFKPVFERSDDFGGTVIQLFKIDWDSLYAPAPAGDSGDAIPAAETTASLAGSDDD